ncbi:hypothetical protein F5H01DRAFT_409988 [Linnemannia elongata]|nr:hypothetical protein F5H01DRAFT_409988 [Linnemannia elongata]
MGIFLALFFLSLFFLLAILVANFPSSIVFTPYLIDRSRLSVLHLSTEHPKLGETLSSYCPTLLQFPTLQQRTLIVSTCTRHVKGIRPNLTPQRLFRSSTSESKVKQSQSTKTTLHHLSTPSAECDVDIVHAVSTTEVKNLAPKAQPSALPTVPRLNIFPENISPPVGPVSLPEIGSRFDTTPQLALCLGLISNARGSFPGPVV